MESPIYYCYILSNNNRTVLYIGFTNNILRRIKQHKRGVGALFTKKYNAYELVYLEKFFNKKKASQREKQLKSWRKSWKWELVKKANPDLITLEIE